MQSFSFLIVCAAGSLATKLLLPLYQYPEGTAWDPVYSAIEANPQLEFQIILNVDDGPGGSEPNSDFVTGTSKLNSYPNVVTLGYVHCLDGEASQDELSQNTTDWAAWNSYAGGNTSVGGIFFDETPNSEGGADDVSFMQTAVEAAKSAFGSHAFTGIFNPGATVEHDEFWTLADYIVIFEDDASAYSSDVLATNVPSGKAGQASVLIPEFADVGTAAQAQTWLQEMAAAGLGSGHILNFDYMQAASSEQPAPLGSVAAALAGSLGDAASGLASSATAAASSALPVVGDSVAAATTATSPAGTAPAAAATDSAETEASPAPSEASSTPTPVASPTGAAHSGRPTASGFHRHHHWMRVRQA